jgi:KilA-N domain
MSDIITATFAGQDINIRLDDRYMNITQICRANAKRVQEYLDSDRTREYVAGVSQKVGIPTLSLIEIGRGRGAMTWAHPDIALHCAQWCSWECAHWVIRKLRHLGLAGVALEIAERGTPAPVTAEASGQLDLLARAQDQLERAQRQIEHEHAQRRRDPTSDTLREATNILRVYYGDKCPCPHLPVHPIRKAEWDHYRGRNDRRAESGWLINDACHDLRPKDPVDDWDDAFRRYQRCVQQYRMRHAARQLELSTTASDQASLGQLAMFETRVACNHCRRYTPIDDPQCHICGQKADA